MDNSEEHLRDIQSENQHLKQEIKEYVCARITWPWRFIYACTCLYRILGLFFNVNLSDFESYLPLLSLPLPLFLPFLLLLIRPV